MRKDILDKQTFLEVVRNASPELDRALPKHGTNQLIITLPTVHKRNSVGNLSNILRLHGEIHEDIFDDLKALSILVSQQTNHTHQIEFLIHDILTLAKEDGIRGAVYHCIISILMLDDELFHKFTGQRQGIITLKGEDDSYPEALEVTNCVEARIAEIVEMALVYEPDVELFLKALAYATVRTSNSFLFNSVYHLNRNHRKMVIDTVQGLIENTVSEESQKSLHRELLDRCQHMQPIEYVNLGCLYERAAGLPVVPEAVTSYRSESAMGYLEVIMKVIEDGESGHVQPLLDILNFHTQGYIRTTACIQTTTYFSNKALAIIVEGGSNVFTRICENAWIEGMSGLSKVSNESMLRLVTAYHDVVQSHSPDKAEPVLIRIHEEVMKEIRNANLIDIYEAHYLS